MTAPQLRLWQQRALTAYQQAYPSDFLATATPGAGKTTFGLELARALFATGRARRLVVVTPTDHLRTQWVDAAVAAGFDVRTTPNREKLPPDADGVVATYAQVAAAPAVFAARCKSAPSVVLFDELHHAGDANTWGEGVVDAFDMARHRVGLTGTPFRSDSSRIPHVTYVPVDGAAGSVESVADVSYGYGQALRDGVVRPVVFASYSAATRWVTDAGEAREALLGDPTLSRTSEDQAWQAALSPDSEWIPHVFAAMQDRLDGLRAGPICDAAALVLASNQADARAYADVWESVNGYRPVLVLSDDPAASQELTRFRDDPDLQAAISVRMVSEGVDVPRAAVLGLATRASTPLFFAQAVGRVVRSRRRGETATVFLPAVSRLLGLASTIEQERNHVLGPPQHDSLDVPVPLPEAPIDFSRSEDDQSRPSAAAASFHDVITATDGTLPGLLSAEQEAELLARSDAAAKVKAQAVARERARNDATRVRQEKLDHAARVRDAQRNGTVASLEGARIDQVEADVANLRRLIADAVRSRAHATGQPIERAWADLYRAVPGPKNAAATRDVLQRRLVHVSR